MLTLLYVMDSLRPDFLGCYGDGGVMTPHLDMFAAIATRYTNAYALAPWSKASGAAMFTGELPRALKMRKLTDKLPANVPTVAERMGAEGYLTVAVTANPFISHDFGLLRGFNTTIEAFHPDTFPQEQFRFHQNHFLRVAESLSIDPAALVLARSDVLHKAASPYLTPDTFLMVWSMDTHAPFFVRGEQSYFGNPLDRVIPAADAEWLTNGLMVRDMVSLYRDMIAYNDHTFGALMEQIRERGLWENALIIVTGDHGEAFGEHGLMGHTNGLWEEQVKVPLLIKFPRQATGLVENRVIGLDSIFSVISQQPVTHPTTLYLENPDGWAIRQKAYKAIAPKDDAPLSVFNLETDPQEQRPLQDMGLHHVLKQEAMAIRASADMRAEQWHPATEVVLDPKLAERLRGLGYL